VVVGPNDLLVTAYQRMKLYDVSQLPVMDGEDLVGFLDESEVLMLVYGDEAERSYGFAKTASRRCSVHLAPQVVQQVDAGDQAQELLAVDHDRHVSALEHRQ
jgi:cystathionine beta-synthase